MLKLIMVIAAGALGLVSCTSEQPQPARQSNAPSATEVLGMKQIMNWITEPSAALIWESVGTVVTAHGEENRAPSTDEEWEEVGHAATIIAESSRLLLASPYARDNEAWTQRTGAMIEAANAVLKAAEARDAQGVFDRGGELYATCTACHAQYVQGMPLNRVDGLQE